MNNKYKGLFFCLLVLLVWLPWPLGGNRPWAWPVMSSVAFILLACWLFSWLRMPYQLPRAVRRARYALMLMGLWLVYLLVQIVPMPEFLLRLISPSSASAYAGLSYASISVDRAATFTEFIKCSTYVAMFFLVLVLVEDKRRLKILIFVIVGTAVVETLYGMVNVGSGTVMGYWKAAHDTVSGSYINRNHYAGFMEIAISLGIGLLLTHFFGKFSMPAWRDRLLALLDIAMKTQGVLIVFILTMMTGLVLSASRGGVIAFTVALFLVVVFTLLAKRSISKGQVIALMFPVFFVVLAIILNSSELFERLVSKGFNGRDFVWDPGLNMAKDYSLLGSGLGTFQSAFPFYYPSHSQTWWHAHMDYLELFIEQGVVGFILFSGGILMVLGIVVRSYLASRDAFSSGILFGVLLGAVSLLIHEVSDYHFYIPANAAYFYVLLAIGVVAASLGRRVRMGRSGLS